MTKEEYQPIEETGADTARPLRPPVVRRADWSDQPHRYAQSRFRIVVILWVFLFLLVAGLAVLGGVFVRRSTSEVAALRTKVDELQVLVAIPSQPAPGIPELRQQVAELRSKAATLEAMPRVPVTQVPPATRAPISTIAPSPTVDTAVTASPSVTKTAEPVPSVAAAPGTTVTSSPSKLSKLAHLFPNDKGDTNNLIIFQLPPDTAIGIYSDPPSNNFRKVTIEVWVRKEAIAQKPGGSQWVISKVSQDVRVGTSPDDPLNTKSERQLHKGAQDLPVVVTGAGKSKDNQEWARVKIEGWMLSDSIQATSAVPSPTAPPTTVATLPPVQGPSPAPTPVSLTGTVTISPTVLYKGPGEKWGPFGINLSIGTQISIRGRNYDRSWFSLQDPFLGAWIRREDFKFEGEGDPNKLPQENPAPPPRDDDG